MHACLLATAMSCAMSCLGAVHFVCEVSVDTNIAIFFEIFLELFEKFRKC